MKMNEAAKRALLAAATEAKKKAYAPYSHFSVGAALLCRDGSVYTGVNIENASYSATVCAERTALFSAVADGKRAFSAIAIVGGEENAPCFPCGVCRQALCEFCGDDFTVLLTCGGEIVEKSLGELLPNAFRLL